MYQLPQTGYVRLSQIIGNKNVDPPQPPIIPVCSSTWWSKVKTGEFPSPIKISANITVWKVEDIRDLIERISNQEAV
jgi:hypothetical protein